MSSTATSEKPSLGWNALGAFLGTATVVLVGGLGIAGMDNIFPEHGFAPGNHLEFLNGTLKEMGHAWSGVTAASGILVGGFVAYIGINGLVKIYRTPSQKPKLCLDQWIPYSDSFKFKSSEWNDLEKPGRYPNRVKQFIVTKPQSLTVDTTGFIVNVVDEKGNLLTAKPSENNTSLTKEEMQALVTRLTSQSA